MNENKRNNIIERILMNSSDHIYDIKGMLKAILIVAISIKLT